MAAHARRGVAAPVSLLLVHGPLSTDELWRPLTDLIADDPELRGRVAVSCFPYRPVTGRGRDSIDTAADRLAAHLWEGDTAGDTVVFVTHGQGGLVVQRFLSRVLLAGRRPPARISGVVMFACPNNGSRLVPHLWRRLWSRHSPQNRQVRMAPGPVRAAGRTVLDAVVERRERTTGPWRLPVFAYGGDADRVVRPREAVGRFTETGTVPGDHRTLVRPADRDAPAYRAVRDRLLTALEESAAAPGGAGTAADEGPVSVVPPYGRLEGRLRGAERYRVIAEILSPESSARVHVLAGAGGTGKSRTALEVAQRAHHLGRRVWWIANTQLTAGMREVANQLGAPGGQVEQAFRGGGSATDLVWRFLDDTPEPWLLVFDNAHDPERLGPLEGRLSDNTGWLRRPANPHGLVVVTSTDSRQDSWVPGTQVHLVRPLGADDGASLLRELAEGGGTVEQARALSTELGGLPVALRAAAAYIGTARGNAIALREPTIRDFDSYRAAVKRRFESPPGSGGGRRGESLGLEVMAEVCNLALNLLAEGDLAEAAPLLKTFACLSTAPIPYRLLMNSAVLRESPLFDGFPLARREAVLRGLARLCLVDATRQPEAEDAELGHVLSLSPVVHGLLRDDPDVTHRRNDYYGLTTRLLLDVTKDLPPDEPGSWPAWSVVAPHAIEVARTTLTADSRLDVQVLTDALQLARLTARYFIVFGLLRPARTLTHRIIAGCETFGFALEDPAILWIRHEAARVSLEAGELREAEAELRLVLAARQRVLGTEHEDTLASGHKLARALLEQGRFDEAMPLLNAIRQAEYRVRGAEHSDTITVRHSWARALWETGRPAEAEAEVRDIRAVSLRDWSPTKHETLRIRLTLTRFMLWTDRPDKAETEIESALNDAAGRPDSPATLTLRFARSLVWLWQERYDEAIGELGRLIDDRVRVLGSDNPETERTRAFLREIQEVNRERKVNPFG